MPVSLGKGDCSIERNNACSHGTFIVGFLGARRDAAIPGLCPECRLLHVPLFAEVDLPSASVARLAEAISVASAAGAKLINLSLAIVGDDAAFDKQLADALDYAESKGAVVLAAAGNQGRLAMGQLLSHPVTIPVVAIDGGGRPLPDCNFGPLISRRGVVAYGHEVLGYAAGGGTTVMSGTSVATAVATATLARLWQGDPHTNGADIRAAVASLDRSKTSIGAVLDLRHLVAALDHRAVPMMAGDRATESATSISAASQGVTVMRDTINLRRSSVPNFDAVAATQAVTPARSLTGCSCGAPEGNCTCTDRATSSTFIYVLGTVDIRFPDQSISEELQTVAITLGIEPDADPNAPLREWYYRVLSRPEARYVARKVCWILEVEGQPAYYLALRDLHDLSDLISCLGRPEVVDGPREPRGVHQQQGNPLYSEDLDLFVGSSSLDPIDLCPGIAVPVLAVDQLCSFAPGYQTRWFERKPESPKKQPGRSRRGASNPEESESIEPNPDDLKYLFKTLVQSADNLGDTDEWRALNFLAARYQPLYERYIRMVTARDAWILDSVKVMRSRLARERHIVDPVFAFRNLQTGVTRKYFVRVDVSHMFPMIVNHIADYFDR